MNKDLTCLRADCQKFGRTRGLCYVHYNRLCKQVAAKLLTWDEAEAQGLCLPAKPKYIWMNNYPNPHPRCRRTA